MAIIKGTNGKDVLNGTGKADTISGFDGDDKLRGLGGNDRLLGGEGSDSLDGGAGRDTASWENTAGGVRADLVKGTAVSLADEDQVDTLIGIEDLVGSKAADELFGDAKANTVNGGGGDDSVLGGAGKDRVEGGAGNDVILGDDGEPSKPGDGADRLFGGAGDDRLFGEGGRDLLFGGAGEDSFEYRTGFVIDDDTGDGVDIDFGQEIVMDFSKGEDQLSIADVDGLFGDVFVIEFAEFDTNKNKVLDDGDEMVEIEGVTVDGSTKLSTIIDVPDGGDEDPGTSITVFGVTGLKAGDFSTQPDDF